MPDMAAVARDPGREERYWTHNHKEGLKVGEQQVNQAVGFKDHIEAVMFQWNLKGRALNCEDSQEESDE